MDMASPAKPEVGRTKLNGLHATGTDTGIKRPSARMIHPASCSRPFQRKI